MAKHSSPIRLDEKLMKDARVSGTINKRSAAEQVEYWADIGKRVSNVLNSETLLRIQSGICRISVEEIPSAPVDAESVFEGLEASRASGAIASAIGKALPVYQASNEHPTLLERIEPDGTKSVGRFENGIFNKVTV